MNNSGSITSLNQEVSGQSAFWVLITLAVAAVCQPAGTRADDVSFGGNISLLRTVPVVCLWDGIMDAYAICKAVRERRATAGQNAVPPALPRHAAETRLGVSESRTRLNPNVVAIKLAIALIAVVPQTVKIFSMRGVPWTQFTAAIFTFASAAGLIMELSGLEKKQYSPVKRKKDGERENDFYNPMFLGSIGQICSWVWIWYNIGFVIQVDLSQHVHLGIGLVFIQSISVLSIIAQTVITVRGTFRGTVMYLGQTGPVPLQAFSGTGCFLFLTVGWNAMRTFPDSPSTVDRVFAVCKRLMTALLWMLYTAFGGLVAAGILDFMGRKIAEQDCGQDMNPDEQKNLNTDSQPHITEHSTDSGHGPAPSSGPRATDNSQVRRTADDVGYIEQGSATFTRSMAQSSKANFMRFMYRLLCIVHIIHSSLDRRVKALIYKKSRTSDLVALTIFNLVTTVCYYLINFDGTGTSSPAWTSILG
ncbi:hypothetical protein G7054_g2869 [Neopestalotiopsis clavispora]|nr:hypothetical protein G7054_g2869 [Neopestalotiopsis clavispora]